MQTWQLFIVIRHPVTNLATVFTIPIISQTEWQILWHHIRGYVEFFSQLNLLPPLITSLPGGWTFFDLENRHTWITNAPHDLNSRHVRYLDPTCNTIYTLKDGTIFSIFIFINILQKSQQFSDTIYTKKTFSVSS